MKGGDARTVRAIKDVDENDYAIEAGRVNTQSSRHRRYVPGLLGPIKCCGRRHTLVLLILDVLVLPTLDPQISGPYVS